MNVATATRLRCLSWDHLRVEMVDAKRELARWTCHPWPTEITRDNAMRGEERIGAIRAEARRRQLRAIPLPIPVVPVSRASARMEVL